MRTRSSLSFAALALGVACPAHAANMITNGAFVPAITSPTAPHLVYVSGSVNPTALSGWTISAGTIDLVPASYWQPPSGLGWSVDLVGTPNAPGINAAGLGEIRQTVATTVPGTEYFLSFELAINPETFPGFPDELNTIKRLEVFVLGNDNTAILGSTLLQFHRGTRGKSSMEWGSHSIDFTADGATTVVFRAAIPGSLPNGLLERFAFTGPIIGNIVMDEQGGNVPEPASIALLGVALPLLLRRRR
jgi:hypothetical protein